MLWPTRLASPTSAASIRAASQSAIAGIVGRGGPSERPWPGRSTASTLPPFQAK